MKSLWLVDKRDDLLWIIFPLVTSFSLIGTYYILSIYSGIGKENARLILYLFWALIFDSTHVFATYTRTYFDKKFFIENSPLLLKSFLLFLVGLIFILSSYILGQGFYTTGIAFIVFNRFAFCYAFYHLIRQHWGFIVIYRNKNNEINTTARKLDSYLLAFGTAYAFITGIKNIKYINETELIRIPINEWLNFSNYTLLGSNIPSLLFRCYDLENQRK